MSPTLEHVRSLVASGDQAAFRRAWELMTERERALIAADLERVENAIDWSTPGTLAQSLDPLTVQTAALALIDAEMVANYESEGRAGSEGEGVLFSMAPQEGKSTRITVFGVLWLLHRNPDLRIGIVSYSDANAARLSRLIRSLIEVFNGEGGLPDVGLKLAKGSQAASRWDLAAPHKGGVYAVSIGGGLTGHPLDALVIDDPVKDARDADSLLKSSQAWEWWVSVGRPRLSGALQLVWLVMTRWHEADLSGRMQSKEAEDAAAGVAHYDRWRVVNIPAQADHNPAEGEVDVLGREFGEFLESARGRSSEEWEATKAATPPRFWVAMFQGRPAPALGDIWLKTWWKRYGSIMWSRQPDGTYRLPDGYTLTQSWDMAFKDTSSSDFVVGQVWAKLGADSFLIYQVRNRLSFTETVAALRLVTRLFPQAHRKLVEDKANGTAVIDSLRHEIPGIVEVEPEGGKIGRAIAVTPFLSAGNVHLPTSEVAHADPQLSFDVEGFILEATVFPTGANDDQVDATSQYLHHAYLVGADAQMLVPTGRVPSRTVGARGPGLGARQRQIAAAQLRRQR